MEEKTSFVARSLSQETRWKRLPDLLFEIQQEKKVSDDFFHHLQPRWLKTQPVCYAFGKTGCSYTFGKWLNSYIHLLSRLKSVWNCIFCIIAITADTNISNIKKTPLSMDLLMFTDYLKCDA